MHRCCETARLPEVTDAISEQEPGIKVREATAADVEPLVALINAAYRVEDFFIDGDRTNAEDLREHMSKGTFLLADGEAGELQGSVYVQPGGERGYFGLLSVSPTAQGVGLGRKLVGQAEQFCSERGATSMDLKVVNLRQELPTWYARLGYHVTGSGPFSAPAVLKRPANFITMSKALT
jgi:GNAT superfamily N-acetyltransferase